MNRSCVAPFRSYSHAKTTHQPPPISESCILDAARTRRSVFNSVPESAGASTAAIVHTLRMSQTITTITIMVPTTPKPSISFLR